MGKMKIIELLENMNHAISVKELAKILGDSTAHVYRRIHKGEIPGAFRDGRRIKICPAVFVEWLKKQISDGCKPRERTAKPSNGKLSKDGDGVSNGANNQPKTSNLSLNSSNNQMAEWT
jgi:excisionase family DNA binding protein